MDPLMKYISRIHRCAKRYRGARLCGEGLSAAQHVYILQVCKFPGITQDALAGHICVNKSNVTRQLGTLEQSGYVERRPDPADRRVLHVYPTAKAQEIFPQVRALMQEWNRLLLEGLSSAQRAQLTALLEHLTQRAIALTEQEVGGPEK